MREREKEKKVFLKSLVYTLTTKVLYRNLYSSQVSLFNMIVFFLSCFNFLIRIEAYHSFIFFYQAMIDIYTVDAFTRELFKGNPAGVCTSFRDVSHSTDLDKLFQQIATEMNIIRNSFYYKSK